MAIALNTLELLAAEKASTAAASVEAIHSAVALPVDDILNDACNVMERYIGHQPDVVERLQHILRNARDIKQVIQKVGQSMAPTEAQPPAARVELRPLAGRPPRAGGRRRRQRPQGRPRACWNGIAASVETAHDGSEAQFMVRSLPAGQHYDAIISDIRLPDMSGYELLLKLKEMMPTVPMVLMTGFGYDPGHSIVKARQAGLQAVLYKPFRLDQLLETVEQIVTGCAARRRRPQRVSRVSSTARAWRTQHCSVDSALDALHSSPARQRMSPTTSHTPGSRRTRPRRFCGWPPSIGSTPSRSNRKLMDVLTGLCGLAVTLIPLAVAEPDCCAATARSRNAAWSYVAVCAVVCVIGARRTAGIRSLHPERTGTVLANHTIALSSRRPASPSRLTAPGISTWLSRLPGNQVLNITVQEKELAIPRLAAAHDGLRIVHLTDLHMSGRITQGVLRDSGRAK